MEMCNLISWGFFLTAVICPSENVLYAQGNEKQEESVTDPNATICSYLSCHLFSPMILCLSHLILRMRNLLSRRRRVKKTSPWMKEEMNIQPRASRENGFL